MKKLSLIIALVLVCTTLFSSCEGIKNGGSTTEASVESTQETTKKLSPEEQKELELVEKLIYNLTMAETYEEVEACVMQYDDEYGEYIVSGFPRNDYIVEAAKFTEYKDAVAYNVKITRETDEEYIYTGVQLFSYTDEGELLINLDEDLVVDFCEEYECLECEGTGILIKVAQTSGAYDEEVDCPECNGIGFKVRDKKVTE